MNYNYPYGINAEDVRNYLKKQSTDRLDSFAAFIEHTIYARDMGHTKGNGRKAAKKGKKVAQDWAI